MSRPKKKSKSYTIEAEVEKEYWEDVEYICPKTGKTIKQRVKITKYRTTKQPINNHIIGNNIIDRIEKSSINKQNINDLIDSEE